MNNLRDFIKEQIADCITRHWEELQHHTDCRVMPKVYLHICWGVWIPIISVHSQLQLPFPVMYTIEVKKSIWQLKNQQRAMQKVIDAFHSEVDHSTVINVNGESYNFPMLESALEPI